MIQRYREDGQGVGETCEIDGADVVYEPGRGEVGVGVRSPLVLVKAGGVELLEDVERLLEQTLDVVLVGETDDCEELGELDGMLVVEESVTETLVTTISKRDN